MNLDKINHWLVLVANVGVVAGIVFLAIEIQQNTNAIQTQTYQSLMEEMNTARWNSTDPVNALIMTKYIDGLYDEMAGEERFIAQQIAHSRWGIYETAFYARDRGVLGSDEWKRFELVICSIYSLEEPMWEQDPINEINFNLTPRFRNFVVELCVGET